MRIFLGRQEIKAMIAKLSDYIAGVVYMRT